MSILEHYQAYFNAFEIAYDTDDWADVASFFTEDAVYEAPGGFKAEGREAVAELLKKSLDMLDRRFPVKRRIEVLESKREASEDYLKVPGNIHYMLPGQPTLVVYMHEDVWFRNGKISRLVDVIPKEDMVKMMNYLKEHKAQLGA